MAMLYVSRPDSLCLTYFMNCLPLQPPHQFKKFKYEMPGAVEGRATVKSLSDDVKAKEKELKVRWDAQIFQIYIID